MAWEFNISCLLLSGPEKIQRSLVILHPANLLLKCKNYCGPCWCPKECIHAKLCGPVLSSACDILSLFSYLEHPRMLAIFFSGVGSGCEITGFPAFRDTQNHCRKAIFLTRISEWKPCKNQGLGKAKPIQGFWVFPESSKELRKANF